MKARKKNRITRLPRASWITQATIVFALCPLLLWPGLLAQAQDVTAADVTLTDNGSTVTLDNGVVAATITKSSAKIVSYIYNGYQMVDPSGNIYYSMDGGASYEQPSHCVYSVKINTADLIDLSFKRVYDASLGDKHVFDIEVHYVLKRGDSGVYAYAILDHPAGYAATSVGEWRMVWKLPRDTFERIYVDALRNWEMPSSFDFSQASPTSIAEIIYLNTGVRAGLYDGKYEYSANYADLGTWGHASNINNIGVWLVFGSHEWFNDGPTKNDLTSAAGIIHVHFGMNHYGGSGTSVGAGEAWSKIYGPYLLYCNSAPAAMSDDASSDAASPGDAMWADAQARAVAEQAAWPYSWLTGNSNYPLDDARGTVSGRFVVADALKSGLSGANAWVGLAQPDAGGNWQFESKRYQYWAKADAGGNFSIAHVRPGTYTLYAFTTGAVGEYSQGGVSVTAGTTTTLGDVMWNVPHPGTSIAWEIGVPDRSAAKFWHGADYFQGFVYNLFRTEFFNPLEYNVGTSNWATDWNFAHTGYDSGRASLDPWKWRINFNLSSVPASGNATLTLAWASANSAAIQVFVNDESTVFKDFYPNAASGGNALIRQGVHAKYGVDYIAIPVSLLRQGANTITLVQRSTSSIGNHVMYDYLNLELP
jgi:rhamnogalacturonan endolyase